MDFVWRGAGHPLRVLERRLHPARRPAPPGDLTGEADKWTGTWRAPTGPCAITVADATNGVLTVTSTKPVDWWR